MAVVVERFVVVVDEVPAVHVVDVAVAVVVDAVVLAARTRLPGIRPDVGRQVGMVVVHPGVDHRDDDGVASGCRRPGFWSIDVCIRRSGRAVHGLTRVAYSPELSHVLVVREGVDAVGGILFGESDARIATKLRERTPAVGRRHRRDEGAKRSDAAVRCRSRVAEGVALRSQPDSRVEADQNPRP
jgi:hypothetical protein